MGVVISLMSWAPLHVHISYGTTVFLHAMEQLQCDAVGCSAQLMKAGHIWTKTCRKHSTSLNVNGFKALIS